MSSVANLVMRRAMNNGSVPASTAPRRGRILASICAALDGGTYWNNEAMNPRDYKDLEETPTAVAATTSTLASNTVHLTRLLAEHAYPGT